MKVNLHTSHPSAFISSTFNDLREERQLVADTLRESGLNVNALDVKPASTTSSKKEILNGIQESDFVILLVGNRYGSILPKMTRSTSKSITWWEYETACRMRKPVIAFFKNITNFKASDDDDFNDLKYQRKRFLFKKFKEKITSAHNPAYFADPIDLSKKVRNALIPTYRSGVMSLLKQNSALHSENADLKEELERLRSSVGSNAFGLTTPTNDSAIQGLLRLARGENQYRQ